jgi:lipopolysaccharide/colanic/teichoic acid biosynthesis glycosyltransferase
MQRFFDILFSGLALLTFLPLLLLIVIFLRLTGEGEVFYLQDRIGINGKTFKLYKFATMLKNSPNMGTATVTVKNDPRVLPAGKFLRKTKINELPQLLNIFFGDMSVIGPRPLTLQTFSSYTSPIQRAIKQVRPGLSGIGSIVFRGEEDILAGEFCSVEFYNKVITPYKGSLEEWYIKNQSLKIYFTAIFVTGWVVIFPKSTLPWQIFNELPIPPDALKDLLNYP